MRTLAVGDIHGCLNALTALLEFVGITPEDRLITLGDYVDRGPNTRGVLNLLIDLHAGGRLIALRGNHEEMMVASRVDEPMRRMWLQCGGRQTLDSYDPPTRRQTNLDVIPNAHWQFLEKSCVNWFETESHFFVHASAYPDLPLEEQPTFILLWESLFDPVQHISGKTMICGHTRQTAGLPLDLGSTICIDTGAYDQQGWLTCLDVGTGRYWQTNQLLQRRTGFLNETDL